MKNKRQLIVFTGGGTGGPVTPLLAVYDVLRAEKADMDYLWLGTENGPERQMVEAEHMEFQVISAGKWRRYFDWQNFWDVGRIIFGFLQSFWLFWRRRPALVLSAGSFVSVAPAYAAWLMRVPVLVHQQDARPGLANRLMAPIASIITVSFARSLLDYKKRSVWTGNPVRSRFRDGRVSRREAAQKLGIDEKKKTVLVMGGGTGARAINELVWQSLPALSAFCQIIHITGQGKQRTDQELMSQPHYRFFEFLDIKGMAKVFAAADIAVSRCGLGTLTELSYLGIPSILIPIPRTHQEENAAIFRNEEAALVLDQEELDSAKFTQAIKSLLGDQATAAKFRANIKIVMKNNAAQELAGLVNKLAIKNKS